MIAATKLCLAMAAACVAGAAWAQSRPAPAPAAPARSAAPAPGQGGAPAPAPPVPTDPVRTTASFGDWTLRCERLGEAPRICEVVTSVMASTPQGQTSTVAQLAIGRPAKGDPQRITVVLPSSVSFAAAPRLAPDEKARALVDMTWRRCLPAGCFADAAVDPAALQALRALSEPGRIVFRDGVDREVALPVSVRGLPQALDALAKEGG